MKLLLNLVEQDFRQAPLRITILACSKGAEVYSIVWTLLSAHPDLVLNVNAVDISQEIIDFAKAGTYSRADRNGKQESMEESGTRVTDVRWHTFRDQSGSIFERMSDKEVAAMFELNAEDAKVRSWIKEGIKWIRADATDSRLLDIFGSQDIVMANRFLCHMAPLAAETCLRAIARLVKPGGYLFVSGIDLDVRTKVVRDMNWSPVTAMLREVHEGDSSLTNGWPLEYWGAEPFCDSRPDWKIRYASVFQIGKPSFNNDH